MYKETADQKIKKENKGFHSFDKVSVDIFSFQTN